MPTETEAECCGHPDGLCQGCDSEHGHTCIVCDEEWCDRCWDGAGHAEFCDPRLREDMLQ